MTISATRPATYLRFLCCHDLWTYEASGTLTSTGALPQDVHGEIAVTVAAEPPWQSDEVLTLVFSQHLHVALPHGECAALPMPDWRFAFRQDSESGDVAILGDTMTQNGAWRVAAAPQVFYPGQWSADTAYANNLDFGGGEFVRNTLRVLEPEQIATPAGQFTVWKAEISSESSLLGRIEGVDWWAPELGAPVKFTTDAGLPDGSRLRLLALLKTVRLANR